MDTSPEPAEEWMKAYSVVEYTTKHVIADEFLQAGADQNITGMSIYLICLNYRTLCLNYRTLFSYMTINIHQIICIRVFLINNLSIHLSLYLSHVSAYFSS